MGGEVERLKANSGTNLTNVTQSLGASLLCSACCMLLGEAPFVSGDTEERERTGVGQQVLCWWDLYQAGLNIELSLELKQRVKVRTSRGLWYRFTLLSPGKPYEKRKCQPTLLPLDLHNITSLKEMTLSTFFSDEFPIVSFRPLSREQCHQRPLRTLQKIVEKEVGELDSQLTTSRVCQGNRAVFLSSCSHRGKATSLERHFRRGDLPSWDHG